MLSKLKSLLLEPHPLRRLTLGLAKSLDYGSYEFKLYYGLFDRPNYAYILDEGARLAKRLGHTRVSAIEFGVAGGRGLLEMERLTELIERKHGVQYEIYGFDTGQGLPAPVDYRDLPYHWQAGFFAMDVEALRKRLKRAKVVLGDVRETAHDFFATHNPAPIAAVSHDFDYYSSTAAALEMFKAPPQYFLPRVFCYFDDTVGGNVELYNDYTGQLGAINDYNAANPERKLCRPEYLKVHQPMMGWHRQIFIHHDFVHPDYTKFISAQNQQLAIDRAG